MKLNGNINVDFNTICIFNFLSIKHYVLSVFITSKFLRNQNHPITINTIKKTFTSIEKYEISENCLKKALLLLTQLGYLTKNNGHYNLQSQIAINIKNKFLLKKNFYTKSLKISKKFILSFKKNGNINFSHYLNGEVIIRLFKDIPTTHRELKTILGVNRYNTKKIDLKKKLHKIKYNDKKYSAIKDTKFNIVTVGVVYLKNKLPTKTNSDRMYHDTGKRLYDSLDNRSLGRTQIPFFSDRKKSFIKDILSFNYQLSRIRNKTVSIQPWSS